MICPHGADQKGVEVTQKVRPKERVVFSSELWNTAAGWRKGRTRCMQRFYA